MLDRHDDVVRRLAEACHGGDFGTVRTVLAADAVAICDGGGLVLAALGPVHGAEDVAQLVVVLLCGRPDTELTVEAVNGRAGLALRRAGRALTVVSVKVAGTRVAVVWIVLNPAKLRGWHRP
ncbi:siderophore-interacting protein [Phytohabitans flavus]|uniref:siderophore-interacting protein n=1 Tax=Phytohabitans flavus TaxID=1076124 RepID=UPI0015677346|nr:siderophore-interacting protein [Phytohabitans flavus]